MMARTVLKKSAPLTREQCAPGLWACKERLEASDIPPDRARSFWHLLSNLPAAASEAFRPRIVRDGWQTCGYYPFTPLLLMNRCTLWLRAVEDGGLTGAEKMSVLNGLPALKLIAQAHGRVSDAEMEVAFPFLLRYPTGLASDLGVLATNRDRCALLVHPEYFASKKASAAAAKVNNPLLRMPRTKPKVVRPRQKWEAFDERSNRCCLWEIEAQLSMRGKDKEYAKTKPELLQLWQKYSAMPDIRPAPGSAAAAAAGFEVIFRDDEDGDDVASSAPAAAGGGGAAAAASLAAAAARISFAQQQFLAAAAAAASSGVALAPAASHLHFTPVAVLQARLAAAAAPAPAAPAAPGTLNVPLQAVPLQAAAPAPAPAASAATQSRKARACSMCQAIGHQKNNCPKKVKAQ